MGVDMQILQWGSFCRNGYRLRAVKLEVLLRIFIIFHGNTETYLPPEHLMMLWVYAMVISLYHLNFKIIILFYFILFSLVCQNTKTSISLSLCRGSLFTVAVVAVAIVSKLLENSTRA